MKFQQSVIDYRVIDADEFPGIKKYGYKQIAQIRQKSYEFQFLNKETRYQLQLQFRYPAIVNQIQLKMKQVDHVEIDMYNKGQLCCSFSQMFDHRQTSVYRTKVIKFEQKSGIFNRAIVRFLNVDAPRATCIHYLVFKGHVDNKHQEKTIQNAFQSLARKNKKDIEDKKAGEQQRKETQKIRKTHIKDLIEQVKTDRHRGTIKIQKIEQDTQLLKAIQQSKKQHEIQMRRKGRKSSLDKQNVIKQEIKHQQITQVKQQEQFFDYQIMDWNQVKKYYEHVTPEWIQAQRAAEKQRSIQFRHSIAEKIKPKIFKGRDICICNITGKQKADIIKATKEMGGNIIQEPKNRCLVITNKMEGSKILLAKQMQNVKFVRPNYVHECYNTQSILDEKDYKV